MTRDEKFQMAGWILFIVCAGFYTLSSLESGSLSSLIGSIVFLVACFIFMVPLVWKDEQER